MTAEPGSSRFTVRRGTAADVEALVDLFVAVAAEGRWIGREVVDRSERHAALMTALASSDGGVLVAEAAGGVIGHLGIVRSAYGVADLGMMVAEGWRRRGVGTALLAAGVGWAREAGAHKVALQVWPHNEAARRLYRSFGFAEEGWLRRHYRRRNGELWDVVVMGLVLEEGPRG